MANSVYKINKGINKPVEFKGLKAQYIWYLAGGILVLMTVFALLYIIGVNSWLCVGLIFSGGTVLFMQVYRVNNKYGEHGLMKKMARRSVPKQVKCWSRKIFMKNDLSIGDGKKIKRYTARTGC